MDIDCILKDGIEKNVSDLFIVAGAPLSFKIGKYIIPYNTVKLTSTETMGIIQELYKKSSRDMEPFLKKGDDDFSFALSGIGRFRVNAYKQRGSIAAVIRMVKFQLPDYKKMGIPKEVMGFHKEQSGLILVTGPAGSGKTTTLTCIIDQINQYRNCHIVTLEDPIEYIHQHKSSIISQREVHQDTINYIKGLRAALRECPEVIFIGEMRDLETMEAAIRAAETGQLIFSTLHTLGAIATIDRIIDSFPANQQQQIRMQLAMSLKAIISEQLIPKIKGGLVPAFEVMRVTPAISNIIREAKVHQLNTILYSSKDEGMISMDTSLIELYEKGLISKDEAIRHSINYEFTSRKLQNL